jgi:hypothetical protein
MFGCHCFTFPVNFFKTLCYTNKTCRFRSIFFIFGSLIYSMEESVISIIIALIAFIVALLALIVASKRKAPVVEAPSHFNSVPLQLQAYERLVLLTERISLPNLISRINEPQFTAKEMQVLLNENIKQEFEYNASQQIYVSPIAWEAVRNLRDQNMLIINQVANLLPPDARASELNKKLLEVLINHEDKAMHSIVLDALNFEAKKLMK